MKLTKIIVAILIIFFTIDCYSQLKVNSTGLVGINKSNPQYNLDLYGTARFWATWGILIIDDTGPMDTPIIYPYDNWVGALGKADKKFNEIWCYEINAENLYEKSDGRFKENIKPLKNSLDKIKLLNAVSYNKKKEFYNIQDAELLSKVMDNNKEDLGFIAQEVMDVIPEVVVLDTATNFYKMSYVKLIPVLVQAIQELEDRIKTLENNCCNETVDLKSGSIENTEIKSLHAKLYQNTPNPFSVNTTIRFEVPESVQNSHIHVFNMTGSLLKTIRVNPGGEGNIVISANEFTAGMYLYSLVCDGRIVDTKQMLLSE